MTLAEDLGLNPGEFEQWTKVFPELTDGDAPSVSKVQTWIIWKIRTPRHWRQYVRSGMPEDMWPLTDPPPLVLHERLGIDLSTAVRWRMSSFDENIDEKFYDLWLELGVEPNRASTLLGEYEHWRRFSGETNGDLRATMRLLKIFGIHLSIENFLKYRNLDGYGVSRRQAKESRQANRWYRVRIRHLKWQLRNCIPRFIYRLFYKYWSQD